MIFTFAYRYFFISVGLLREKLGEKRRAYSTVQMKKYRKTNIGNLLFFLQYRLETFHRNFDLAASARSTALRIYALFNLQQG